MAGPVHGPQGSKVATVLRVTSGNFLEMFDFFLFGIYASHISKAFFPAENEFASLMFTFMGLRSRTTNERPSISAAP